jgi:ribonuclease P protein component
MPAVPRAANACRSDSQRRTSGAGFACGRSVFRLQSRSHFQAVLAGRKLVSSFHFVVHGLDLNGPASQTPLGENTAPDARKPAFVHSDVWLGAMVPKRWARRAVTRNAIKRQIYTVANEFAPYLPRAALLVRLRAGFDRSHFTSASSSLLKAAVRAELLPLFDRLCVHGQPEPQRDVAP